MQKLVSIELAQQMQAQQQQIPKEKVIKDKETKEPIKRKRKSLPKSHKYYQLLQDATIEQIQAYNNQYEELFQLKLALLNVSTKEVITDLTTYQKLLFGFTNGKNRLTYKYTLCTTNPDLQLIYYKEVEELELFKRRKPPVIDKEEFQPITEETLQQIDELITNNEPYDEDELPF